MQITATVRLARPGADAEIHTRTFSALPSGRAELVAWLLQWRACAAIMEATGIYREAPHAALEQAGIEVLLVHAQHVKQLKGRKTDIADSVWLARIGQFGLCRASLVPPAHFRALRKVSRLRRQVVRERARMRNRIHKILDAAGVRVGGILSDLFGANGLRILEGLDSSLAPETILKRLSYHVRAHLRPLCDALSAELTPQTRFMLHDQLRAFRDVPARIAHYEAELQRGLAGHEASIDLLGTIPGIDRHSARAILIELGPDIGVFASNRHCAAWAGLCPGNNESAGKRRSGNGCMGRHDSGLRASRHA